MSMYNKIMNWLLWKLVYFFKNRVRVIYTNGQQYLLRLYLTNKDSILPRMFVHCFLASDKDRDSHNHPWPAKSLILAGMYRETRLTKDKKTFETKVFKPGMINNIEANDFHKVELITGVVWTLFFPGKKKQGWGFWDVDQQSFIPSEIYLPTNNNDVRDLDGNKVELFDD